MMGILKKMLIAGAGAAASYYATKWVAQLLEEKPLDQRLADLQKMAEVYTTAAKDAGTDAVEKTMGKKDELIEGLQKYLDSLKSK